jgi:hypothetical protein
LASDCFITSADAIRFVGVDVSQAANYLLAQVHANASGPLGEPSHCLNASLNRNFEEVPNMNCSFASVDVCNSRATSTLVIVEGFNRVALQSSMNVALHHCPEEGSSESQ